MSEINTYPKRIISLTPSLTEILFALELSHRVAGVTDSCNYPAGVKDWPHVACWFDPDLEKLFALKPDLVLGLQTAHSHLKIELESEGIRVVLLNPITVDEVINDIAWIGQLLGAREKSEILTANLRSRLTTLDARVYAVAQESKITVLRILDIEEDRFYVAGPLSFQYDIISRAGGQNVTCSIREAYPKITLAQLREWDPQMLFNCGFDLNSIPDIANNPEWQSLRAVQSEMVFIFDCGLTCRTGPRIVDMVEILFNTLYRNREKYEKQKD